MPIVRKVLRKFIKQYGKKEGERRYFAWEKANPGKYKKSLRTARKHKDRILKHLRKKKLTISQRIARATK